MFSDRVISKIREIQLTEALDMIGAHWHVDNTFRPRHNPNTRLLLINNQIEMTMTEPKFVLRKRGKRERYAQGGGAIDLVMQLTQCSFPDAVRMLLP